MYGPVSLFRKMDVSLRVLLGFTVVAVVGFGTFGLHPEWLQHTPSLGAFYAVSFSFFGQAHVWLCGLVLGYYLVRRTGWRWGLAFVLVYAASLLSELAGTTYGVPFGAYGYSSLLGPKWFGRVPVVIPLSWFLMAVPSYALALHALPEGGRRLRRVARIGLASLLLAAWDLSLDPAMSYLTRYWTWGEAGPYYGMPLLNLFGWFVTGLVLMVIFDVVGAARWMRALSVRWLACYYGLVLLMPLGMVLAAGLWGAAFATVGVLGAVAWAVWGRDRSGRVSQRARPAPERAAEPVTAGADLTEMGALRDYFRCHSRSFSFAALWFPAEQYRLVASVYAFCRTTDDLVDIAEGLPADEVRERLETWRGLARRAYETHDTGVAWLDDLLYVSAQAGVPFAVIDDLIDGVRMDLGAVVLADAGALHDYTYRVASVVGIWLCHLFGVRDERVLQHAAALGRAMQVTNILRDVGEDLALDRVYLPADRMARFGVTRADLDAMANGAPVSDAYRALVDDLMAQAEADYARAFLGLPALPPAFGRAVAVAAAVYRGIHGALRRNGYDNFHRRAYTKWPRKVVLAVEGLVGLAQARRSVAAPAPRTKPHGAAVPAPAGGLRLLRHYLAGLFSLTVGVMPLAAAAPVAGAPEADGPACSVSIPDAPRLPVEALRVYYVQSVEEAACIDDALARIAAMPAAAPGDAATAPVVQAYGAALVVLKAKHAFWPTTKMAHLRRGLPELDRLVAARPDHAEIRYLRLLSCYYLPGFLGRKGTVDADLRALVRVLPAARGDFAPALYRDMVRFVLNHAGVSASERHRLTLALEEASPTEAARGGTVWNE